MAHANARPDRDAGGADLSLPVVVPLLLESC